MERFKIAFLQFGLNLDNLFMRFYVSQIALYHCFCVLDVISAFMRYI